MAASRKSTVTHKKAKLTLFVGLLITLGVWITFFDSHSIVQRLSWHQEHQHLTEENEALRTAIAELDSTAQAPLSDETVEKIAREQYGMRKDGETVYKVEEEQ